MRTPLPLPVLAFGLLFLTGGCLVVATQPPDPGTPDPTPTATVTPDPKPTSTATPDPTPTATTTTTSTSSAPSSGPQVCGSRGLPPCPGDQFCDFPAGSQCGATDGGGVCKPKPEICTREFRQVCGCDGVTYSNPCSANAKGASVSRDGKCN